MRKPIALATSVRRQLRKQFSASLARARFHTAWTHKRHAATGEGICSGKVLGCLAVPIEQAVLACFDPQWPILKMTVA
jgi:hypothetical protein